MPRARAGERDGKALAALKDFRIHASEDEILQGNWRDEHLFALKQALAAFAFYGSQLADCDADIEPSCKRCRLTRALPHAARSAVARATRRSSTCASACSDVRCRPHAHRRHRWQAAQRQDQSLRQSCRPGLAPGCSRTALPFRSKICYEASEWRGVQRALMLYGADTVQHHAKRGVDGAALHAGVEPVLDDLRAEAELVATHARQALGEADAAHTAAVTRYAELVGRLQSSAALNQISVGADL